MAFFDKMSETLTTKGKDVAKKAKELAEITGLNSQISIQQEIMNKAYISIGKAYYEQVKDNPDELYVSDFEKVTKASEKIQELKRQVNDIKGIKPCSACGSSVPSDASFCPSCGNPVSVKEDNETTVESDAIIVTPVDENLETDTEEITEE